MAGNSFHLVVIPYPAQGHVNPIMHVCQSFAKQGIKITMVNTEVVHNQMLKAMGDKIQTLLGSQIEMVSVSDGFPPDANRFNVKTMFVDVMNNLHTEYEKLLTKIIHSGTPISCVLADLNMAWVLEISHRLGIKGAIFSTCAAAHSALVMSINKLIEDGIVDKTGVPTKEQKFQLRPGMPSINTLHLPWRPVANIDEDSKKILFEFLVGIQKGCELSKWCLINTTYELDPASFTNHPKFLSVGPLVASEAGQFWKEDTSCLDWLDQQPPSSVIYIAFGSFTVFTQTQFEELAMGFELTGRPYLWVVRPGSEQEYPKDYKGTNGKIIGWAPQQKVLSHPSVGCFLTHCGWGSVLEGLSNGLPFLCWPFSGDHFPNRDYIEEIWKTGVGFDRDENGIVSRWEIKKKVDKVVGDESFKARSKVFQEKIRVSIEPGGLSYSNVEKFVRWVKEEKNED